MSTLPTPTFATLLRRARRAAGLTQEALAERAGISVDTISIPERGLARAPQAVPYYPFLEALATASAESLLRPVAPVYLAHVLPNTKTASPEHHRTER